MLKYFDTYQLARSFYLESEKLKLPKHLRDQLSRAASSVALNIAEGSAKPTRADQKKFYFIALGSLRESQAVLDLVTIPENLAALSDRLGACLHRLCHAP